jgi:transcriptional regulator with XRE-family HTH domain
MNLSVPAPTRESADSVLAKNLVVARTVAGVTQQELASRADISRATVAQIETGSSDPRLSTIVELANALGVPPLFLLVAAEDVRALCALHIGATADGSEAGGPLPVSPADVERMQRHLRTGMLKDRLRAARLGAAVARAAGHDDAAVLIGAAIFSAVQPGPGTVAGTALGEQVARSNANVT